MRWKLLRRRLSVSAPRMIVRSHIPWPLRWAVLAVVLGFSAAIALWAFEFGKEIAGLDRGAKAEVAELRAELASLKDRHGAAQQVANAADSLLKAERVAQERLVQQVRQLELDKQALQDELGFFQRLIPASGEGLQVRGLSAEPQATGRLRYQMLLVHQAKGSDEFRGRYEVLLSGQVEGKAWQQTLQDGPRPLQLRRVTRVAGVIDHPPGAVLKSLQVRVMDAQGATRATQTVRL
ncbi:MAG: DUF6776 family protein [Betaproteobacteria bacterium]|jgi:hypothetical protein|nr:hypothetical protein [Rubrivivax sp.]